MKSEITGALVELWHFCCGNCGDSVGGIVADGKELSKKHFTTKSMM